MASIEALLVEEGDRQLIASPKVGLWSWRVAAGERIVPGTVLGWIEVLGVRRTVIAPDDAHGFVAEMLVHDVLRTSPVEYAQALLVVGHAGEGVFVGAGSAGASVETSADDKLVFVAPSSGRYYSRPAPDQPPFVSAGEVIELGQTVCLLEVMKTFNRVCYEGDGLPAHARVVRVGPADGDDVEGGELILALEPVG